MAASIMQATNVRRLASWLMWIWLVCLVDDNVLFSQIVRPESDDLQLFDVTRPEENALASLQQRLADLEEQLKKQDDGNKSKDGDKKFVVRPFGRLHMDAAAFDQDDANKSIVGDAQNGLDIRRARLGVEGEGYDLFFYRFDVDFVGIDVATGSRVPIIDAYVDTKKIPWIGNLRVGHFREPFSLERLDSTHDLPFMERTAAINTLTPFRNMGIMAFDWNEEETMTWAYGIFDENTNEFGEDLRDSAAISGTARVTWLPYFEERHDGQHKLHLGASYSIRRVGENDPRRFASVPEIGLREGISSRTPNFVDTGLLAIDTYHVGGVEIARDWGPFAVQGEYVFTAGDLTNGRSFFLQGGYVEAMYWWTGESRNYLRHLGTHFAVTPNEHLFGETDADGCRYGGGAWESTLRLSTIDLNDNGIRGGRLTDLTVGLNWYYTTRSRVMVNYVHAFLDRDNRYSNANIFAVRYQIAF